MKEKKKIWKLLVHHWKSSKIAPFLEHPVYIIFRVENVLDLACWFSSDTSCSNSMYKTYIFSWILGAPQKWHRYFSFCIFLYIVFSMFKVSWFLIADFTLTLVTQTLPLKRFYSQSFRCSAKEATILIGHPEKWPESC